MPPLAGIDLHDVQHLARIRNLLGQDRQVKEEEQPNGSEGGPRLVCHRYPTLSRATIVRRTSLTVRSRFFRFRKLSQRLLDRGQDIRVFQLIDSA